jgi:hypothetical protein
LSAAAYAFKKQTQNTQNKSKTDALVLVC